MNRNRWSAGAPRRETSCNFHVSIISHTLFLQSCTVACIAIQNHQQEKQKGNNSNCARSRSLVFDRNGQIQLDSTWAQS